MLCILTRKIWEQHSRIHKHTHTCKLHCNDSVTHIRLHLCVYEECTSILANCRHPDECFCCWPSSVQCSPNLLSDYPIPYHSPTHTGPSNLWISLDSPRHTHTCPHTSRAFLHPWLTTPFYATTHMHTLALTALCTHSVSHVNATWVADRCTCTFIYTCTLIYT